MQPLNGTYPCPHHRGGTHRKEAMGCRWASVVLAHMGSHMELILWKCF